MSVLISNLFQGKEEVSYFFPLKKRGEIVSLFLVDDATVYGPYAYDSSYALLLPLPEENSDCSEHV